MSLLSQKERGTVKEGAHLVFLSLGVIPNPHCAPWFLAYFGRHTQTDIRNQSPVILGLVGLLLRVVVSSVPLGLPPDQKYDSLGAPHVSYRGHIAFNSTWGEPTRGVSGLYSTNTSK